MIQVGLVGAGDKERPSHGAPGIAARFRDGRHPKAKSWRRESDRPAVDGRDFGKADFVGGLRSMEATAFTSASVAPACSQRFGDALAGGLWAGGRSEAEGDVAYSFGCLAG